MEKLLGKYPFGVIVIFLPLWYASLMLLYNLSQTLSSRWQD